LKAVKRVGKAGAIQKERLVLLRSQGRASQDGVLYSAGETKWRRIKHPILRSSEGAKQDKALPRPVIPDGEADPGPIPAKYVISRPPPISTIPA
jgi:hypothetical protein